MKEVKVVGYYEANTIGSLWINGDNEHEDEEHMSGGRVRGEFFTNDSYFSTCIC